MRKKKKKERKLQQQQQQQQPRCFKVFGNQPLINRMKRSHNIF